MKDEAIATTVWNPFSGHALRATFSPCENLPTQKRFHVFHLKPPISWSAMALQPTEAVTARGMNSKIHCHHSQHKAIYSQGKLTCIFMLIPFCFSQFF